MVLDAIAKRRSVREYSSEEINYSILHNIIAAGQFAPSAMNNHSVGFVFVKKQESRKKLCELAQPRQEFVANAPIILIPYTDPSKTPCPIQDISVATENIMIEASALGVGTVWKNLNSQASEDIKKFLEIPESFVVINVIPIGTPKNEPTARTDMDFDNNRIREEKY